MNSSDITNTVIIILIFGLINLISILGMGIDHIKDNWKQYQCMPIIIPLAGVFGKDANETFNNCSQNILLKFLDKILGPLYTVLNQVSGIGRQVGYFMSSVNGMGNMFKFGFFDMLSNVYKVGTQILLGLTQFSITLQDMINRVLAVFLTVIYIFLGANYTILSIWNGLPGQLVRFVTGA
jgi:hypothetical protein